MAAKQTTAARLETTPDEALAIAQGHSGPLLVDLDETLYLRNSTEDFIDTARPAALAFLLMRLLDFIKPWRWTGGEATRDIWRVRSIALFFPWTRSRWAQRARELGNRFRNEALAAALADRGRPFTVVTLGFREIVTPLIEAMAVGECEIVACRSGTADDRLAGKLAVVQAAMGPSFVADAAAITDSVQDEALLRACKRPALTRWPGARYRPAFRSTYLPGQYLDLIKRPRTGALKSVLVDDFPLWVLASLPYSFAAGWAFIGLALLFVSFWAVYEIGYVENDMVAAKFETDPQLSPQFREFDASAVGIRPWVYAACFGILGILCLRHASWSGFAIGAVLWAAVLAGTRAYYRLYNFADKQARAWLYLGLQALRVGAFAAVAPITPIGALACAARAISRWQIYFIYRQTRNAGGYQWILLPERTIALALFALLLLLGALAGAVTASMAPIAAMVLAWTGFLARREIAAVARNARTSPAPKAMPGTLSPVSHP